MFITQNLLKTNKKMTLVSDLNDSIESLKKLRIGRYEILVKALTPILLPENKGSVFHGALGSSLKSLSDDYYDQLFNPETRLSGNKVSPYIIRPPIDQKRYFNKDSTLKFEIILLGPYDKFLPAYIKAFYKLGNRGLGSPKEPGRFELIYLKSYRPFKPSILVWFERQQQKHPNDSLDSSSVLVQKDQPTYAYDIMIPWFDRPSSFIGVELLTRLRLIENNKSYRKVPSFRQLLNAALRRLELCHRTFMGESLFSRSAYNELLNQADNIKIKNNSIRYREWNRYSKNQNRRMPFGGLIGNIIYEGELEPLLPWLALGEWLHIGSKSSFGLGQIKLF